MRTITLREHQLITLDILKYFNKICIKHNIKYSLGGGTLIGAVRHQGFIPWDDDIDVYMCRDEYEKFIQAWESLNHERYRLSLAERIDGVSVGETTKIYDLKTHLVETNDDVYGIFIDIFVWDGVPDDPKAIFSIMKKHKRLKAHYFSIEKREKKYQNSKIFSHIIDVLKSYFFNKMMEHIYSFQKRYPIKQANTIAMVLFDYNNWKKAYMPKEYFNDVIYLDFEGDKYPVMKGYHQHLTVYYGDYMQLPPIEQRIPHHIKEVYLLEDI
ncbi:phosphorylcholine transferase LicD [Pasteurella oralis]|uniref:Phosphorylcholine transferase LicD n=1 Tax=Pasteurella oralis TaxID=1071947 RepID=A0ABW4NUW5_9PAST